MRSTMRLIPVLFLPWGPMVGQSPDGPCPSGVVRWDAGDRQLEGTLLEPPEAGKPLRVKRAGIEQPIELSSTTDGLACRLRDSAKGNGALIGLAVGAGLGGFIGLVSGDDDRCVVCFTAAEKAGVLGLTMGLTGALIGTIASHGATWVPMGPQRREPRLSLSLSGKGIGLRWTF